MSAAPNKIDYGSERVAEISLQGKEITTQYEEVHSGDEGQTPTNSLVSHNGWLRKDLHIYYQPNLIAGSPLSPSTSPKSHEDRARMMNEFFTDEDGRLVDPYSELNRDCPDDRPASPTRTSLRRTTTVESTVSHWTISDDSHRHVMQLQEFIDLIAGHRSLQNTEILSAEGYRQKIVGIKEVSIVHRYLVLELKRHGQDPIWLRLDRRRDNDVGALAFLAAAAETRANDQAQFAACKEDLISGGTFESRQVFTTTSTLGELRHLLQVICDELDVYKLWPANCWFFVSLLQQHLQGEDTECFVDGSVRWGETAQKIRSQIKERLRLVYHIPEPFSTQDILFSLQEEPDLPRTVHPLVLKALERRSQWIANHELTRWASSTSGLRVAELLSNIASDLESAGQYTKAMWIRQRAVDIARELCKRDPRNHRDKLASYLHALGLAHGRLQHPEFALRLFDEATMLFRSLYTKERRVRFVEALQQKARSAVTKKTPTPTQHRITAQLAKSLQQSTVYLYLINQRNDSCARAQEEVRIQRELYAYDPEARSNDLANSLATLGDTLRVIGRFSEACGAHQEATELRRTLFRANPGAHRASFAVSLNGLASTLLSAGRLSEGFSAYREAVKLKRELVRIDPNPNRGDLALHLYLFGNSLYRSGRFSESCSAHQEAVMLKRELFDADPDTHSTALALQLNNFSMSLQEMGRFSDAYFSVQEAVALQRGLFRTDPDAHRLGLAGFLDTLCTCLRSMELLSDACCAGQEAVTLQRELFHVDPNAHRPNLAILLRNLGGCLHAFGRGSDACTVLKEAVMHGHTLYRLKPEQYKDDLLASLKQLAKCLSTERRSDEASAIKVELSALESTEPNATDAYQGRESRL